MEKENYLQIMSQSLKKKEMILDKIIAKNMEQAQMFADPNLDPDDLERNLKEKSELIEQINQLDEGFTSLYGHIEEELKINRAQYANEIEQMQEQIKRVTDKSVTIQTQEKKNHSLAVQQFSNVKKQIKQVQKSHKVVNQYYKNMMNKNYTEPQFLDNKK